MSEIEREILQALAELENTVSGMAATSPKPDLRLLFARIDELTRQLPREADPELLHFLQRKSYQKARAHLEGRQAERGSCGH